MNRNIILAALIAAASIAGAVSAQAESFRYHGSLQDGGAPANGSYDLKLSLYSAEHGGTPIAGPITLYNVAVHDGSFSAEVDFGQSVPAGGSRWLGVAIKSASGGDFVALDARSEVSPEGGCTGAWTIDGNSGNPPDSYLGTADNKPLIFKVNGNQAVSITPGGGVAVGQGTGFGSVSAFGANSFATGELSAAGARASFAGGSAAIVRDTDPGSFMWGDRGTSGGPTSTAGPDQFIVRAGGGVGINTSTGETGQTLLNELTIRPSTELPGLNVDVALLTGATDGSTGYKGFDIAATFGHSFQIYGEYKTPAQLVYNQLLDISYSHHADDTSQGFWHLNGATGANTLQVGAAGDTNNGNGAYLTQSGVWTNASSRTWKEGFAKVDVEGVLSKLVSIPVQSWFYKGNHDDGKHIGPVAEDFASMFGLGSNNKYIGTVDESGVAFAAIQGLNKKLEAENADLHAKLDAMLARLDRIEKRGGQ